MRINLLAVLTLSALFVGYGINSTCGEVSNGKSTTVTCTDVNGQPQNVEVRGLIDNTVIINCKTDMDGAAHITVKGDGATREIGAVKIQGGAENVVIINNRQLGADSEIIVEGKNAKASVGNVEVKGGKLNKSAIINNTTINGGRIEAKGDGANVSIGTVSINE